MFAHLFKPVSDKEEIVLKLHIVHCNTIQQEEIYMADVRANVKSKWKDTLNRIDEMHSRQERGEVVIYG